MTDKEIIKALEICSHRNGDLPCEGCPAYSIAQMCMEDLMSDAFDLINRKNAEIERYKVVIRLLEDDVATEKSEAIKEFADMFKNIADKTTIKYVDDDAKVSFLINEVDLDNLVKEMAGEQYGNSTRL